MLYVEYGPETIAMNNIWPEISTLISRSEFTMNVYLCTYKPYDPTQNLLKQLPLPPFHHHKSMSTHACTPTDTQMVFVGFSFWLV